MPPSHLRRDLKPGAHLELVASAHAPLEAQHRTLARIERATDDVLVQLVVLDEHRAFVDVVRLRHDGGGGSSVRLRPRDLRAIGDALAEARELLGIVDRPARSAR